MQFRPISAVYSIHCVRLMILLTGFTEWFHDMFHYTVCLYIFVWT